MRQREERVLLDREIREISVEAMRALLRFVQSKTESGVVGNLPLDAVQKSKDFYHLWKRRKPFLHNRFFGFCATVLALIFSFTSAEIGALAVGLIWFFYAIFELDKTKTQYTKEMIGNMANFTQSDRDYYISGLLSDVWGIESEKFRLVSFIVNLFFIIISILIGSFFDFAEQVKMFLLIISGILAVLYFIQDPILTKRVKFEEQNNENIYLK